MIELAYSARGRIESIILRAFSAAVALTGIEVVGNALIQNQYLEPWHWLFLVFVSGSHLGLVVNTWVNFNPRTWLILVATTPLPAIAVWPFLVGNPENLPNDYQPWIWWAMGMAAIAAVLGLPRWLGFSYLLLLPAIWFAFRLTQAGGEASIVRGLQDASLVFFLGAVFGSLILLMFSQGKEVDLANTKSLSVAIEKAQVDARERERGLVEALVHDRVLNTLILANRANSDSEFLSVAASAKQALLELQQPINSDDQAGISSLALFRALKKVAFEYSGVQTTTGGDGSLQIPPEVAQALTQATLQAVDNSRAHSGAEFTLVSLIASEDSVHIKVADNGRGFRPSKVPKNRLGLRLSIISRVEAVGGWATIQSQPGKGTSVVISWTS